ncbi:MAG: hypothetical protein E6Q97_23340 [Desulfurellales bacterium]|nr:MAG: hypothetical protein E6Q97_23340 [Desulfurellales bacterium]
MGAPAQTSSADCWGTGAGRIAGAREGKGPALLLALGAVDQDGEAQAAAPAPDRANRGTRAKRAD